MFRKLERILRQLESKKYVEPAGIKQKGRGDNEEWHISFSKMVLYKNQENQNPTYTFQASTPLNWELHAEVLQKTLKHDFPHVDFNVEVKPKYKTIPFPFLEIPIKIPFSNIGWHKAPDKVRGDDFLATIPTTINIIAKRNLDSIDGEDLWDSLNKIACLHTANIKRPDSKVKVLSHQISQRASKDPFRWILNVLFGRVLANCIPEPLLHHGVPVWLKRLSRVYPYGHPAAHVVIDTPVINSGVLAKAASFGTYAACWPLLCCKAAVNAVGEYTYKTKSKTKRLKEETSLLSENLDRSKLRYSKVYVDDMNEKAFKPLIFDNHVNENEYDLNFLFFKKAPDPYLHQSGHHAPFATRAILKRNLR